MSLLFQTYPMARRALFSMDPERAHEWTLHSLLRLQHCRATRWLAEGRTPQCPRTVMGLTLRNPVGLAAGLDKNGACIDGLAMLGFGFIEVGTVTPRAQAGNPAPRLFRLPRARCLINRMGFNNEGLEAFIANVQRSQWRSKGGILGLNIGKNADTPMEHAVDDYLTCLDAVYPHADYVTVNISSPNTRNLRTLQHHDALDALLKALRERRNLLADRHGRRPPLVVKIAPDLDEAAIDIIADTVLHHGVDGIIATNTTISRESVRGLPHEQESGGLSGPPVHEMSLKVIQRLRRRLGPDTALIGVGGIESGRQAAEKMQAGADAVQLYTGLIYQGPALIPECVQAVQAVAI